MTFLKKLGQIIAHGIGIFTGFAPLIAGSLPGAAGTIQTVSKDLAELLTAIVAAEAIGQSAGLDGPTRAKFIGSQVAQILLSSAALGGKKLANPAKFQMDCQALGGVLADLLNDFHEDAAKPMIAELHT